MNQNVGIVIVVLCVSVILIQLYLKKNSSSGHNASNGGRADLSKEQLRDMIANNKDLFVLDVRNPDELVSGPAPLKNAVNIPLSDLPNRMSELPRDKEVVVVCHSGMRSARAAAMLARSGFSKVYNLKGGMSAYRAQGK